MPELLQALGAESGDQVLDGIECLKQKKKQSSHRQLKTRWSEWSAGIKIKGCDGDGRLLWVSDLGRLLWGKTG